MSQFTDFGENKIVDKLRGNGTPPYGVSWWIALASAADDTGITEITGTDLARVGVARSLAAWAGTQAPGSTLASSGSSHQTSNNADVVFDAALSDRGTATHYALCDALTGGNVWAWLPLSDAIVINSGDAPTLPAGSLVMSLGVTGGLTNYAANKLIDEIWRGQNWAWPATVYLAWFTGAPSNAGGGIEVSAPSYARAALVPSLTSLSGTQGDGTTGASSGTSGKSSNNAALSFPAPAEDWGIVVNLGTFDAATAGNLLLQKALTPKTISGGGSAPSAAAHKYSFTLA